jgi:hypothetical protein
LARAKGAKARGLEQRKIRIQKGEELLKIVEKK